MRVLLILLASTWINASQANEDKLARFTSGLADPNPRAYLHIDIKASERRFNLGESITFDVSGNRPFYLYLFTEDEQGEPRLLFPNRKDQFHLMPGYEASRIPNKTVEIYADEPGVERVYVLATLHPQDWNVFPQVAFTTDPIMKTRGLKLRTFTDPSTISGYTTDSVSFLVMEHEG